MSDNAIPIESARSNDKPKHQLADQWLDAHEVKLGIPPAKPWSELSQTVRTKVIAELDKRLKELEKANKQQAQFDKERLRIEQYESDNAYSKSKMKEHFDVLGFNDGKYWFLPLVTRKPIALSLNDTTSKGLLALMDIDSWRNIYPKETDYGVAFEPNWVQAGNDLIQECHHKGYFRLSAVRGQGFWKDKGLIIFNDGRSLMDARTRQPISREVESTLDYYYQRSLVAGTSNETATFKETYELYSLSKNCIAWVDSETCSLLHFGWIVCAPFCGILPWRPHIWITAPKGAGKSNTVSRIEEACMMKNACTNAKGATTEAGVRQQNDSDAKPTLLDEMEPNSEADKRRIDRIIEFNRNASSDDEAVTLKGTAGGGGAVSYQMKTMCSYKSINHQLQHEADISRTAVCGIRLVPTTKKTKKNFADIEDWTRKASNENFAGKLLNRSLSMLEIMLSNIDLACEVVSDATGDARMGKQYGVLIGGALTHIYDGKLSREVIEEELQKLNLQDTVASDVERNDVGWFGCWAEIASLRLEIDGASTGSNVTIGEAVDWLINENVDEVIALAGGVKSQLDNEGNSLDRVYIERGLKMLDKALARYGIRYQREASQYNDKGYYVPNSDKGIYLSRKNSNLSRRLSKSKYSNWTTYAQRVAIGTTPVPMKIASGETQRAEFIQSNNLGV